MGSSVHTRHSLKVFATHAMALRLLRVALAALGDADVLPIKGVLYARTLYADPSERPLSDVDLVLARPGLREGVRRLVSAGFTVKSFSADLHVELTSREAPGLALDLHAAPLSAGYGAMTASWLALGAREDTETFGARVLLATEDKQLAISLGSIVRDGLSRAAAHQARDVDTLLNRARVPVEEAARTLREGRFRRGGFAALRWVGALYPSNTLDALCEALCLGRAERAWTSLCTKALSDPSAPTLGIGSSAIVSCLLADAPSDIARGLMGLALGLPLGALNRRLGHAAIPW